MWCRCVICAAFRTLYCAGQTERSGRSLAIVLGPRAGCATRLIYLICLRYECASRLRESRSGAGPRALLGLALRSDGHSAAGRAVVIENYALLMPLGIYMSGLRWMSSLGARVGEVDVVAAKTPGQGWFCWWGSACNLPASTLPASVRLRGFHSAGHVLHVGQFSVLRLRAGGARLLLPGQVARALAKTALPEGYALLVQPPT